MEKILRIGDILAGSIETLFSIPQGDWPETGSISPDGTAIAGRDQFLFLHGGSNDYYAAYSQPPEAARDDVAPWVAFVDECDQICRAAGVDFRFIIVPNKASVISEPYPLPLANPITPRLRLLSEQVGPEHLPLIDAIRAHPQRTGFFRRNDSHFTELANVAATGMILESLGLKNAVAELECRFVRVSHPGDLGSKFAEPAMESVGRLILPENVFSQTIIQEPKGQHTGLDYQTECANAPFDRRLLVFGNSFFERPVSWGMAPYFVRLFRHLRFRWATGPVEQTIHEFKPDIVLVMTCERFLSLAPTG
jgi:hypothetical protein